jgi:HlyD family secretion protein
MNATVDIKTASKSNIITVPLESVTSRSDTTSGKNRSAADKLLGSKVDDQEPVTCIFIEVDGRAKLIPVVTGIQDDKYIEITSGITADQVVISGPYDLVSQRLAPDDKVKVVSRDELYKKK